MVKSAKLRIKMLEICNNILRQSLMCAVLICSWVLLRYAHLILKFSESESIKCDKCSLTMKYVTQLERNIEYEMFTAMNKFELGKATARAMANRPMDDPLLVTTVRNHILEAPWPRSALNLHNPSGNPFFAESSHDEILDIIFQQRENGFFVEAGAFDGQFGSVSLFFELSRNWTGLLVEPDVKNFQRLRDKRRHAYAANACLGTDNHTSVIGFAHNENMQSAIDSSSTDTVGCFPIYTFLRALERDYVDLFCIDLEGFRTELDVLKMIPWDKVKFGAINIEVDEKAKAEMQELLEFMDAKGFVDVVYGGLDIIFLNKTLAGDMPTKQWKMDFLHNYKKKSSKN